MNRKLLGDERGFVMILLGLGLMAVFCAFAALAIDVGHAYMVKGQLQIAADATALAAAGDLYPRTTIPPAPAWADVPRNADNFIVNNKADGKSLNHCDRWSGYWDTKLPPSQDLQSTSMARPGVCSNNSAACANDSECGLGGCLQINVPAVKVMVSKSPDINDGPVRTFFAKAENFPGFQPSATAVAVSGFPGAAPQGAVFPFAMTQCFKNEYLSGVFTSEDQVDLGIKEGNGQWTNLKDAADTDANTIRKFIEYLQDPKDKKGTQSPVVKAGDSIGIASGVKEVLYRETNKFIDAKNAKKELALVFMPVVQCHLDAERMDVRGFVGVILINADEENHKIRVKFAPSYPSFPGSSPGGTTTNILIPPKLTR